MHQSGGDDPQQVNAVSQQGQGGLLQRILQKIKAPYAAPAGDQPPAPRDSLLPPGQRSGEGTESLEPYLDQYRHSRPGRLE